MVSKYYSNCSECGTRTKSTLIGEDGFVCRRCYNKDKNIFNKGDLNPKMSLEKALKKIYKVKGYKRTSRSGASIQVIISCPQILIGRKVKLILCDDTPVIKSTNKTGCGKVIAEYEGACIVCGSGTLCDICDVKTTSLSKQLLNKAKLQAGLEVEDE